MIYVYMMILATLLTGASEYVQLVKVKSDDTYLDTVGQSVYKKIVSNFLYASFFSNIYTRSD